MYDASKVDGIDERQIWFDWLADTTTTSHVVCQREAFTSYTPVKGDTITRVGGKTAGIAGQGTVKVISMCNGQKYILELKEVLHVPNNRNNLVSLRQ
jgi:hypothetical protein